jgi:transposase
MNKPRKHYSAAEKDAILRRHLVERVPVPDLCDQYHIQPSMFYNWQKQFFENGAAAFEQTRSAPEKRQKRRIAALQDKLQRKNEVVAELLILRDDEFSPPKQRHTAAQVGRSLRDEHGYHGGYAQVQRYLFKHRRREQETFIPLGHLPGQRL